jgi:ABC-type multidrug transport system fused ATPase/permease subunit
MLRFNFLRPAVSVVTCLFFYAVKSRDTTPKWQASKIPFVSFLALKLVIAFTLSVIKVRTKEVTSLSADLLDILLIAFQIDEICFCRTRLSWRAYKGAWAIMTSSEMLAVCELSLLPHPSILVPICLLLATTQLCLSYAIMALSAQVKEVRCGITTGKYDNKHDRPWHWEAMVQIYAQWSIPSSYFQWMGLALAPFIKCCVTHIEFWLIEGRSSIFEKTDSQTSMAGKWTTVDKFLHTFLGQSLLELFGRYVLPFLANFLWQRYDLEYEARVERYTTKHITLLDKQSFDETDVPYKHAAIQQSTCACTPIKTVLMNVLPGSYCLILTFTRLVWLHETPTATVIWTIIGLKVILEARLVKEQSRVSKQSFAILQEFKSMCNDIWCGRTTLDLSGQLENQIRTLENLIDEKVQLKGKASNIALMRETLTNGVRWGGILIAGYLALGSTALLEPSITGAAAWELGELFLMMDKATNSLLSAPRETTNAYDATEPLRYMIATKTRIQYGSKALVPGRGSIKFTDVSFGYRKGEAIFKKLDILFHGGKTTVVVGLSGGGKTALIDLVTGQVIPSEGRIDFDGQDIRLLQRKE